MKIERQCTVFRLITCKLTAMHRFFASERQCSVFRQISAENGCGMSKFYTLSSKFCFSRKNARILRKVVVDTTDSLAEGVSCRQPTAVPLRQKIPPAKREQKKKPAYIITISNKVHNYNSMLRFFNQFVLQNINQEIYLLAL